MPSSRRKPLHRARFDSRGDAGSGTRRWALEPVALQLLEALPAEMRLLTMRRDFPHVLNTVAASWNDPLRFIDTIDALMGTDRSHRHGFPSEVLRELHGLRVYYLTVAHPHLARLADTGPLRRP